SETHQLAAALYDVDPLCIDAVYALAERALLDGDTVAAVRLLKDQVRRAQAELGVNPNPEITRLLRRLERGERPAFLTRTARLPAAPSHSGWRRRAACVQPCGRRIRAFPQHPTRPPTRFACAWRRPWSA